MTGAALTLSLGVNESELEVVTSRRTAGLRLAYYAAQPTPPPVVSATHVLWEYDGRPAVKTVPSALRRTLMHSSAR